MKNLLKLAALAAILGAPAFGETTDSVKVMIPSTLESVSDMETARQAIFDAATDLCEDITYVGVSAFYKASLDRQCIAEAYADALAQEKTGRLYAYVEGQADPYLILAQK